MYIERKSVKGPRIGAAIIDWIFYLIMSFLIRTPIQFLVYRMNMRDLTFSWINFLLGLLIAFMYYTLVPYITKGKTLGKLLIGIKVVSSEFERPNLKELTFRNIFFLSSLIIGGITLVLNILVNTASFTSIIGLGLLSLVNIIIYITIFVMILATPEERGFHDMIAGTYVVSKDFDLDELNNTNVLERQGMEWAEFDDDLDIKNEEDEIGILGSNDKSKHDDDQIDLLKNDNNE
ncbi:RDD family protein [Haloplasma contractile]|uniref:Permease protein n=1 Tax=Haloplasma contractile SSD-17B TaxID=1033810 RepID=F7PVY8_9MOLU|nr:RDD family protein [Haloplasma contractile]ERJ12688.1 Permease protein [Haloplasma contractile SSD-17B]